MGNGQRFWGSVADAFSGWKAIALTAAVAFGVGSVITGGFAEFWQAPKDAAAAKDIAEANQREISLLSRSVSSLERTVRIYICTRPELDRQTRIRLDCSEFN